MSVPLRPSASILVLALLSLAPSPAPSAALTMFDDHFGGNSGGIPAGWSLFAGPGTAFESGSEVNLEGDIILISDAAIDPSSGTISVSLELTGSNSEAGVGLLDPATGNRIDVGIRLSDQRVQVTGASVAGGEQHYTAGFVGGYAGGPVRLTLVFDATAFSVSAFPPPFSLGPIAYGDAFASFQRADLGSSVKVVIGNDDAPEFTGWSSIDRVTVEETTTAIENVTFGRIKAIYGK